MAKQKHWSIGFFPSFKNGKLTSALCDQVTQCFSSLTISLVSVTSTNAVSIKGGKRIMKRTRLHASIAKCMLTAAHTIISSWNRLWPWYFAAFSNFLLDNFVLNFVSLAHPSLPIWGKTQKRGISNFRISIKSFIHKNCRTNHDTEMKFRPVTKLAKKNTTTSKILEDNAMSANCDITVFLLIYGQFTAIWKLDSKHMVKCV